ncbi:MAG: 4-alpha-glucanotransferase [Spirochaetaceae bacterium]|nr:4-alpha-glucanotransferase [Spirochaetaceae bacterium]
MSHMRLSRRKTIPVSTGAAFPLGALRSREDCGIGEYPDLIEFADFCKQTEMNIIQLLPVNDTGTESSPYSALSAFALHPIYARLQDFPEAAGFQDDIDSLKQRYNSLERFPYRELRREKLALLRRMYEAHSEAILAGEELHGWIEKNGWVLTYAVYMEQKRLNNEASWKEWPSMRTPLRTEIEAAWKDPQKRREHLFFAWLQMRLDQQFLRAAEYVRKLGIILKGDIPILMNEDSCDAWSQPEFFMDELRAGSPPDGPNPRGQNWGLPLYNWNNLKKTGYSWWKERLAHAARYYSAYRIDHVLGFFRIWAVPERETSAVLGYTVPVSPITEDELLEAGFDSRRVRWFSQPHVPTRTVEAVYNNDYLGTHGQLAKIMDRVNNEEFWLFKPGIRGDRDIYAADLPPPIQRVLACCWKDRVLLETAPGRYTPTWNRYDTTAWNSLSEWEKETLIRLFERKKEESEALWQEQAEELLGTLTGSVDMIPCAEDLGPKFEGMETILARLEILGLRVVRWNRDWEKPGNPYIPFSEYDPLSVTTSSVHDSSTLRGWWLEEEGAVAADFLEAFPPLTKDGSPDSAAAERLKKGYTAETARYLLRKIAETESIFCIHPLQDFLDLVPEYFMKSAEAERVNVPGSVTAFNWTYRIPVSVEELLQNTALVAEIQKIAAKRFRRQR